MYLPMVIDKTGRSTKAYDLPTKLLEERIVYFYGEVNDDSANAIIMQLLWLKQSDSTKDIHLYINSSGGCVYQGLAIFDVIEKLSCKVNTTCVGNACSMGAFLLSCGTGARKASKNARIMLHSVSSGDYGTYHDRKINMQETEYLQNKLINYFVEFSKGKSTLEFIKEKTQRDFYISASEAIQHGLIDEVL